MQCKPGHLGNLFKKKPLLLFSTPVSDLVPKSLIFASKNKGQPALRELGNFRNLVKTKLQRSVQPVHQSGSSRLSDIVQMDSTINLLSYWVLVLLASPV